MSSSGGPASGISIRLQSVTKELLEIQDLLISENEVDPNILTDFRNAVNRIRNTAWAVELQLKSKSAQTDKWILRSLLASERVRVAYQLCKLIQSDLENSEVKFLKGQLLHLSEATEELTIELRKTAAEKR